MLGIQRGLLKITLEDFMLRPALFSISVGRSQFPLL